MTTIVGIRNKDQIVVAADQLVSSAHSRLGYMCKIIDVESEDHGSTVIGVAGPQTIILALHNILSQFDLDFCSVDAVYESLITIHEQLKDVHGLVTKEDDIDTFESSQFQAIIANTSGLYMMLSFREVLEFESYTAVGSGADYALGALHVLTHADIQADALRAIEAAAEFDKDTGGATDIRVIEC